LSEFKLYVSAGIFIALTALKILIPTAAFEVRECIEQVLEVEDGQTQTVIKLGERIADEGIIEAFNFEKEEKITPTPTPKATPTPTPTPVPTSTPTPEPTQSPKVTAFYKSQEAYSEYAVPTNVSLDIITLPFDFTSPVEGLTSSGFGFRLHPILNEVRYHFGTDFAADEGEKICAFADGSIYAIGENDSYGKYMIIDHAGGYRTLYAHCSELLRSSGEVNKGERIALVGQTGEATGPHLHFELMKGETYYNPEFYL